MFMRTFEYRLFVSKEQSRKLLACLAESRIIYNGMLETVKAQYEEKGTVPSKYELEALFLFAGKGSENTLVGILIHLPAAQE